MDFTEINERSARDDGPWGGYDFKKKSLAVIAADNTGDGVVLWTVGGDIKMLMEDESLRTLDELGITSGEAGILVWEGRYVWHDDEDGGAGELMGKLREPNDEEWVAIKRGECPWDDEEWKLKKEKGDGDDH